MSTTPALTQMETETSVAQRCQCGQTAARGKAAQGFLSDRPNQGPLDPKGSQGGQAKGQFHRQEKTEPGTITPKPEHPF